MNNTHIVSDMTDQPCGLSVTNNTCYLMSAIQMLAAMPGLRKALVDNYQIYRASILSKSQLLFAKSILVDNAIKQKINDNAELTAAESDAIYRTSITFSVTKVLCKMKRAQQALWPKSFLRIFFHTFLQFSYGTQDDAADALETILDRIYLEIYQPPAIKYAVNLSSPYSDVPRIAKKYYYNNIVNNDAIANIFHTQINFAKCAVCHATRCDLSMSHSLTININHACTLDDCIREYFAEQVIAADCDHASTSNVTRRHLYPAPTNLLVNVTRHVDPNALLEYPEFLDMTPYIITSHNDLRAANVPVKYMLVGMIMHAGTFTSGHYYNVTRCGGKWVMVDGSIIAHIANDKASSSVFMLMYSRC